MTQTPAYPCEAPARGAAADLAARVAAPVPRVETARLVLRAPVIADFDTYAQILMSDRARQMDGPFTREAAWLDFTQYLAGWMLRGAGLWTIAARADGAVLGFVSCGMEVGDHEHELGYLLSAEAEGQGIAAEAAVAARDLAFDALELPTLVSYVDPGNSRSAALAQRIGAQRDTRAEAAFEEPVLVFRHSPADSDGSVEAYA